MTKAKEKISSSLVDEIVDMWFAELENAKEFDPSTIGSLKQLASSGTIKKAAQVTRAIRVVSGGAE